MRKTRSSLLVTLLVLVSACATGQDGSAPGPTRDANSRVLLAEQIRANPASNAYDLIRSTRPSWLQTRGRISIQNEGEIQVYFDQVRLGGLQALRSITTEAITRIEFIDAPTATQRWGTGHPHGVILISTRP